MEDLTFGEQVKIILGRKGMTIKELAEIIEKRTGMKMSRQNLTQRLGRDNFQEQDMRMIANILGCPFHLSILSGEVPVMAAGSVTAEAGVAAGQERKNSETRNQQKDSARMPAVQASDELLDEEDAEDIEETSGQETGDTDTQNRTAAGDSGEIQGEADEVDMTIGELYEIHEELSELEKNAQEDKPEDAAKEAPERTAEPDKPKKEKFRTGGIFLRKKGIMPEPAAAEPISEEPIVQETKTVEPLPDPEDFEPVIKHDDVEEDLEQGDINPYTGREFQSNSVRMHPNRIGYVQVYDRNTHRWTDMTEWAFLGYQERKKALLGKDYEPPIYLD